MLRKTAFFVFSSLIALASCTQSDKFVINGDIVDSSCNGAQIFLVPLTEPATHETVDSVVIKDGKFTFEGTKARICALRLQMPQRMYFQELLVYTEPGEIAAHVAQVGSVTGTKNNDLLQEWKTIQEECLKQRSDVLKECKSITDPKAAHVIDSLKSVVGRATFKLVKESGLNPFSRFFYMNNRYTLNQQQRSELQFMEDDFQHQLDSIRKVRAAENAKK